MREQTRRQTDERRKIKIGEVSGIFGTNDIESRIILKVFKVHGENPATVPGAFGKPAKLYSRSAVVALEKHIAEFKI